MENVENSFAKILQDYSTEARIQTLDSMCRVFVGHNVAGTAFIPVLYYSCVSLVFRQYTVLSKDDI